MWDLEGGVSILRLLESHLSKRGWHCALGGGVLYKGKSDHDLDVICYPHSTADYDLFKLYQGLKEAGLEQWRTREQVQQGWREAKKGLDEKHVEIWFRNGRRLDIIIWPPFGSTSEATMETTEEGVPRTSIHEDDP